MQQFETALSAPDSEFLADVRVFMDTHLEPDLISEDDNQRMFFGDFGRSNRWLEKLRLRNWHVAH